MTDATVRSVPEITLLTQPDCSYCEHAKQVLTRIAADTPLQITEIDLTSDHGRHLAATAGVLFAPGILLDGHPFGYGRLSERRLRRALHRRATTTPGPHVERNL